MAQQKFNVESGLAVGSISILEANGYANLGDVTSQYANGNTVFGNVKINQDGTIYGNIIGNISGNIVVPGANTQIIFNNQGNAGASSGLTFDSANLVLTVQGTTVVENLTANATVNLGNLANVKIGGGASGQIISSDGTGNLVWSSPAGTPTEIANGTSSVNIATLNGNVVTTAGGSSVLTVTSTGANIVGYANVTGDVTVGGELNATGGAVNFAGSPSVDLGTVSNLHIAGGTVGQVLSTDGFGNLAWTSDSTYSNTDVANYLASGTDTQAIITTGNIGGANLAITGAATFGGNVLAEYVDANADITAAGTVYGTTGVVSGGDITASGNVSAAKVTGGQVVATGNATVGNLSVGGISDLGGVGNVKITGGTSGYVLQTDGTGNLSWVGASGLNYGNADVAAYLASGTDTSNIETSANVIGGNLTTSGVVAATGNVSGGNVTTTGVVSAGGNVSGGNLTTSGEVVATGNVAGGNLTTAGQVVATGNVTGGNLVTTGEGSVGTLVVGTQANLGAVGNVIITGGSTGQILTTNGSGVLSWSSPAGTPAEIANGTSSVAIAVADGNVVSTVGGSAILNVNSTGANLTGQLTTTGNVTVGGDAVVLGNLDVQGNVTYIESNVVNIKDAAITLAFGALTPAQANGGGFNIDGANASFTYDVVSNSFVSSHLITTDITGSAGSVAAANLTGSTLSANVTGSSLTSLGTLTGLDVSGTATVTGNVAGGNLTTAGQVVATGNVTGGNLVTTGQVSASSVNAGQVIATADVFVGGTTIGADTATVAAAAAFPLVTMNVPVGRSVEFLTRGWDEGSNAVSVVTTMVVTDGNANVQYTNYGAVSVIASVGTVAAVYGATAGQVLLEVTPTTGNVTNWVTQYRMI